MKGRQRRENTQRETRQGGTERQTETEDRDTQRQNKKDQETQPYSIQWCRLWSFWATSPTLPPERPGSSATFSTQGNRPLRDSPMLKLPTAAELGQSLDCVRAPQLLHQVSSPNNKGGGPRSTLCLSFSNFEMTRLDREVSLNLLYLTDHHLHFVCVQVLLLF